MNRQADQGNRIENPQIHLSACGNLVYDKVIKSIRERWTF